MFTRRLLLASLVSLSSLAAGALFVAPVAQAEAPKLVSYGSFSTGPVLADGVAVDNSCSLHVPPLTGSACTAFDQSSGDVYVASFANSSFTLLGHVDKFDASLPPKLLAPSPFGEGLDAGTAVNPTNGELYVLSGFGAIETYDPGTGKPLPSFPVQGSGNIFGLTLVQIAADSAGNVYVPVVPENKVLEYKPSECPALPEPCALTPIKTFTGSGAGALKEPTGVAVDSSGNLWVADAGNNRIEELSAADVPLGEIKSQGVASVALDGHGDVLAIVRNSADFCGSLTPPCSHLVEYGPSGVQLADVGAASFGAAGGISVPSMVAVSESSGRVYVTDSGRALVWVFGPPTAPVIDKELTAQVGTSEAKLGALVNPGGIETSYRFEYDTREYTEGEAPHGQTTPLPEGSVGEGITSHAVWAAASGLAPGTTYHYRVVATNELGPAVGLDQTFTTETAEQAACPNEALRGGFSAKLPDCRAYELVTPPNKGSVVFDAGVNRRNSLVAGGGDAIALFSGESFPGAPTGGLHYVALRGAAGWSLEDIVPLEGYTGALCTEHNDSVEAYSEEQLSTDLIILNTDTSATEPEGNKEACNAEGLQVVPGEPVGYQNLLLRDNATGAYQLVNAPPPGVTPADAHFRGASADLSHVIFSENAPLTPEAPGPGFAGSENLYEWDEGVLRLLTVLPGGATAPGSLAEASGGGHAISADGSHILFVSGGALYARIDGERTVQVDESRGGPGESGGGSLPAISADGSKVFFLDESKLTEASTAASGEPDLYECALPEHATHCELSDLTVAKAGEHADVLRVLPLASHDSSHVYFVAKGVLATNKREYTDSEGNAVIEGAENGQRNLYMWDGATTTFIAALSENDFVAGVPSPDGAWFAFESLKSLTGYDNTPSSGQPVDEIFLYSAASNQLACASCNPTGEALTGGEGASLQSAALRPLSDGGRLFFETTAALVPSDTNGQRDVYEYANGRLSLISSGTSSSESLFLGASQSGDDVFINSPQQLVPQDTQPGMPAVYDVRVGGGLAAPLSQAPCTTADGCRSPVSPQPSIYGAPSSQTFSGPGNLASPPPTVVKKVTKKTVKCKKGFTKKKNKCVKNKKSKRAKKAGHGGRTKS